MSKPKSNHPRVGVGVMILREGKVLLGRRHDDPNKADSELHGEGTWTMPGGKVEFGEGLIETVIRETEEENGLKIKEEDLELISVTNDVAPDAHFVTIGYLCENFEGAPKVREPDEIIEWKWFPLGETPDNIFPPSKKILKKYQQIIQ